MDYKEQHFDESSVPYGEFGDKEKPYDLSKIEPMPPVPEDDLSEADNEFGQLETGLEGFLFFPSFAETTPYDATANPTPGAYLGVLQEEQNRKNLKQ